MADELARLDAIAQADLVHKGETTPLDLVDAAISRIEQVNPQLNAVITPLFEKARTQAKSTDLPDGPFKGVPFLLKDFGCHSAGDPYHQGTRFLKDLAWTAKEDTYMAAKLRAAGLIFLGKTNTPEFASMPTTEPEAYGPTRNPWNTDHSTGGSSGGSGAAVASGMVPAAHANDGGGSTRVPASECGLVGLKSTRARASLGPEYGELWQGLVNEHVVTRSVRDTAAILNVIAGPMPGDPYFASPPSRPFLEEVGADPGRLRIGFLADFPGKAVRLHPDCVTAVQEAVQLLGALGHTIEEAYPPALDAEQELRRHVWAILTSAIASHLDTLSRQTGKQISQDDVEINTWAMAEIGRARTAVRYIEAIEWLQSYTRRIASWWQPEDGKNGFDLLLTPTIAEPPPKLGEFVSTSDNPLGAARRSASLMPFTVPFNVTGQPAMSLPLYWNSQGLPIGIQLVAAYGREDVLFRVAAQLEQAQPWAGKWPSVHAKDKVVLR